MRQSKPEVALAIECKNKATEIFKYMNEMEIDIRLRFLINFFKGIYDSTENVENYSQKINDTVTVELDQAEEVEVVRRNDEASR